MEPGQKPGIVSHLRGTHKPMQMVQAHAALEKNDCMAIGHAICLLKQSKQEFQTQVKYISHQETDRDTDSLNQRNQMIPLALTVNRTTLISMCSQHMKLTTNMTQDCTTLIAKRGSHGTTHSKRDVPTHIAHKQLAGCCVHYTTENKIDEMRREVQRMQGNA